MDVKTIVQREIAKEKRPAPVQCPHTNVVCGICLACEQVVSAPFSIGPARFVESDPRGKGKTYIY